MPFEIEIAHLLLVVVSMALYLVLLKARSKIRSVINNHFVTDEIEQDSRIAEKLVEIRVESSADRVSVFLFHNGEKYANGNSILKMSQAYEVLAPGISPQKDNNRGILVSTVPESVSFLVDGTNRNIAKTKVADLEPSFYKAVMDEQGVKFTAKYPLRKGHDIVGYVCSEYVQTDSPDVSSLDSLKRQASQIELYINNRKKRPFLYRLFFGML